MPVVALALSAPTRILPDHNLAITAAHTMDTAKPINAESLSIPIVMAIGEHHKHTTFIASGSTSKAFRVTTNQAEYVLRIANPNKSKQSSYGLDFHLRDQLHKQDLPVAKPVATHHTLALDTEHEWAFDEYCAGAHPARATITPPVSRQLGLLLSAMHGTPVSGFGRLAYSENRFMANDQQAVTGFLRRFESPWPFCAEPLDTHPLIRREPTLVKKLTALELPIRTLIERSEPAIIHSDLHEGQLLVVKDTLTALLDFNDAVVGRKELDLGSYLYFHGQHCLNQLLAGYTTCEPEKARLQRHAWLASILIALHHGNRGRMLNRPHRIAYAARFLKSALC